MSFPGLRSFMVFSDYQLNRAELTASSCENVETDKSCQATCHLVKEIKKKESEQERMANLPLEVLKIECLFAEGFMITKPNYTQDRNYNSVYIENRGQESYTSIFHPPEYSFPQA